MPANNRNFIIELAARAATLFGGNSFLHEEVHITPVEDIAPFATQPESRTTFLSTTVPQTQPVHYTFKNRRSVPWTRRCERLQRMIELNFKKVRHFADTVTS